MSLNLIGIAVIGTISGIAIGLFFAHIARKIEKIDEVEELIKNRPKPPFEMIPDSEKWNDWIEDCLQWFEKLEKLLGDSK